MFKSCIFSYFNHVIFVYFFQISRTSIDAVKDWFRDEMSRADWQLIIELKRTFEILWHHITSCDVMLWLPTCSQYHVFVFLYFGSGLTLIRDWLDLQYSPEQAPTTPVQASICALDILAFTGGTLALEITVYAPRTWSSYTGKRTVLHELYSG